MTFREEKLENLLGSAYMQYDVCCNVVDLFTLNVTHAVTC